MDEEKKQSRIWLKIMLTAFYLFIFAILLKNSFGYLDPDFGWHLKVGGEIWQTRAVPDINHEDYTLLGTHWVDHEWLSNVFIYLIDNSWGYIALSIVFALLIVAALFVQLQFTRKYFLKNDRGLTLVLALQAFGLYASLPHLGVRVQELTIFLLLVLSIIIYLYNKNKDYRILFWLLPLFIFWASAHGGFLIGLFILGLFALIKSVELWSAKKFPLKFLDYGRVLEIRHIATFSLFSFLAILATLATPYGLRLYSFLFRYRDSYYQQHLTEWQGQYCFPLVYSQLVYLEIVLIFFALLLFSVFISKINRRRFDLYQTVLIIIFAVLAFKARRHFPLLFIVSLPVMVEFFLDFFTSILPAAKKGFGQTKLFGRRGLRLDELCLIIVSSALILAGALIVLKTGFTLQPEKAYQDKYPYQAVVFLRAHPEWNGLRLFCKYSWGGYLIWQYPERKLFADGRLPQYPLAGRTVLEEYGDFFTPGKSAAQLQRYDIGLVMINPKEDYPKADWLEKIIFSSNPSILDSAAQKSSALLEYLRGTPVWQSVYNDGTTEILVKK
jgi:hypothetical protein